MARREFGIEVRRAALKRSGMKCEAIGEDYGLPAGQRCDGNLGSGFQFDHIIADSIGGEPTLENCATVCRVCHDRKTRLVDTPRAAETKRQAEKIGLGLRKPSRFPGSKNSPFKKTIDGRVIDRRTGEEVRTR